MNNTHNYFEENYTLTEKKKFMSNNYTLGYCARRLSLLLLLVACVTGFAFAQSPTVVSTPENLSYETYGSGFTQLNDWVENNGNANITPADGCGPATWSNNFDIDDYNPDCGFYAGSVAVTFTYTDACDNVINYTRTATLTDDTPPSCVKPYDLTIACDDANFASTVASYAAYWGPVTDLSHPISITSSYSEDGFDDNGQQTITWVFTDACGNSRTWTAVLTVTGDCSCEVAACSMTANASSVELSNGSATISGTASGGTVPAGYSTIYVLTQGADLVIQQVNADAPSFTVTETGNYTIHCLVYDAATLDLSIVVPGVTTGGDVFALTQAGGGDICAALDVTGASVVVTPEPVCEAVACSMTANASSVELSNGSATVSGTASGGVVPAGYSTIYVLTQGADLVIQQVNADAPSFTVTEAGDYTIHCLVYDAATLDLSIVVPGVTTGGDVFALTQAGGGDICAALDVTGASVVVNPAAPVLVVTPPTNYNLSCEDTVPGVGVEATTTCPGGVINVSDSEVVTPMGCPGSFTIVRTYVVSDACGNSETVTQTIVVEDNTPPVFTFVPAGGDVGCDAFPDGFGTPEASDACGSVTITSSDSNDPSTCDVDFNITRTWTATDECGNVATASQTLIVWPDTEAPTVTFVPADYTITCPEVPVFGEPTVTDNCTGVTMTMETTATGACPAAYSTTKTWTFVDGCGNAISVSQTITVLAAPVPPTLVVTPPTNYSIGCSEPVPGPGVDASTTCPDGVVNSEMTENVVSNGCSGSFTLTRTYVLSDNCGNSETVTQTITVTDNTPPVFSLVPASGDVGCDAYPAGFGEPSVGDACGDVTLTFADDLAPYICDADFNITRTWTATDECGNVATASQTLTVWPDTEAPTFTFVPGAQTIQCGETVEFGTPTIIDNCTALTISDAVTSTGSCPNGYTTTKTWTATDGCGNTAVESQTITVLAAPAAITIDFETMVAEKSGICGDGTTFDVPVVISNCEAGYTVSSVDNKVSLGCIGNSETTRVWTAVDACGNTATTQQKITVTDITAPVFNMTSQELTMTDSEFAAWTMPEVIAWDECSATTLSDVSVFEYADGRIGYSWVATDVCENKNSLSIMVVLENEDAPIYSGGLEATSFGGLMIYPNPTAGELTLNFSSEVVGNTIVNVVDLAGKTLSTKTIETFKGVNTLELNVSDLAVGTYFVRMDNGTEVVSHKFVKF